VIVEVGQGTIDLGWSGTKMKPTIKIRFTEPQIALVMRAHPNCNLERLTELLFEFDLAGKIIDCLGTIKDGGNIEDDFAGSGLARTTRHGVGSHLDKLVRRYCNFPTVVEMFGLLETKRRRVGPGDCARPCRVCGGQ
jgi:hypothetical protein